MKATRELSDPPRLQPAEHGSHTPRPAPAPERLQLTIAAHIAKERATLEQYQQLAGSIPDPLVRTLLHFILQDELLHHELLRRMAATLGGESYGADPTESLPIGLRPEWAPSPDDLAAVRGLVREEEKNVRAMERLAQVHGARYGGLFSVLLGLIGADSRKHQRLLEYVLQRLAAQRKLATNDDGSPAQAA